ncbi:MAG: phytanoyl-CoA dioxygenase family protein [Rhodospirillales bacterium]|nr:phytanoyl-CoA dioxygenase family protein [Rhodospirillales bacterium]
MGEAGLARFADAALAVAEHPVAAPALALIGETCGRAAGDARGAPFGLLSGIHNPFGLAGRMVDSWGLLDICQSPAIVDAVEALIGPDIVLWESELIGQPPGPPPSAPHHDPGVWPIDPPGGVTVRIAITGSGPATGGLRYVPRGGSGSCDLRLRPGDVVFHESRLRVANHENRGATAGAEYLIRYMAAGARYVRDADFSANRRAAHKAPLVNFARRPIWLVRGEDLAGNDFVTGFAAPVGQWAEARW